MKYKIFVNFISANQAVDLRSRILRPGQRIENCLYSGDFDAGTFHLGVLVDARIVSNGTFMLEKNKNCGINLIEGMAGKYSVKKLDKYKNYETPNGVILFPN